MGAFSCSGCECVLPSIDRGLPTPGCLRYCLLQGDLSFVSRVNDARTADDNSCLGDEGRTTAGPEGQAVSANIP